jgi:hypothetical protein
MNNFKRLHIVCHDIPWPADYGGVVDLFYKLRALHAAGVHIQLHCFQYGHKTAQHELSKYCNEVHYYPRLTNWKAFSLTKPYIVQSRAHPDLIKNLMKDEDPVLLEGVHCTAFLSDLLHQNRKVVLRQHNVESLYYGQLFRYEKNLLRKLYFLNESIFLNKYEKRLPAHLPVLSVSKSDAAYSAEVFGLQNVHYLPVFVSFNNIKCRTGRGDYCLYHGNLSVAENEYAVSWLLKEVFSKLSVPFYIAGKNPSRRLQQLAQKNNKVRIVANPTAPEMEELIAGAHIHVLPSFNKTGVKLKLINALFNGRHCVVNPDAVLHSELEAACHIGTTADAFASIISQLYFLPFEEEEIQLRKKILPVVFDNEKNVQRLIQWIW